MHTFLRRTYLRYIPLRGFQWLQSVRYCSLACRKGPGVVVTAIQSVSIIQKVKKRSGTATAHDSRSRWGPRSRSNLVRGGSLDRGVCFVFCAVLSFSAGFDFLIRFDSFLTRFFTDFCPIFTFTYKTLMQTIST